MLQDASFLIFLVMKSDFEGCNPEGFVSLLW
jgi:hypothetical protein